MLNVLLGRELAEHTRTWVKIRAAGGHIESLEAYINMSMPNLAAVTEALPVKPPGLTL